MPHNDILAKLKDAVHFVSDNIQNYVFNPGDFSRKGKLPADVLMEFLIGQGSRNTHNELIEAFSFNKDHPSAPALVQKALSVPLSIATRCPLPPKPCLLPTAASVPIIIWL